MSFENKRPQAANSQSNVFVRMLPQYILGLSVCILLGWLMLCIVAKVMCMADIPLGWIVPITTCCGTGSILCGALFITQKQGHSGAVWGGLLALGCWVLLCIIGLMQGQTFTDLSLLKLLAFACAGMIGGITGVFLHDKRKKRIRR